MGQPRILARTARAKSNREHCVTSHFPKSSYAQPPSMRDYVSGKLMAETWEITAEEWRAKRPQF